MHETNKFANLDKYKHGELIDLITNNFKVVEIGGKQVIQTPDGDFIEYVLMEERFFLDNWLAQFAIGLTGNKNYFNHEQWSKYTEQFTKGVIVINDNKDVVLVIRKFIDMDLNYAQQHVVDDIVRKGSGAKYVPDPMEVDQILNSVAQGISEATSQNPDYDTLTALIPMEYYLAHDVDPNVLKQVIWIRDNYTYKDEPIDPEGDILPRIEAILYKNARDEFVSNEEKALVEEITNGEFIFNSGSNKVDDKVSHMSQEDDFDPLAD